MPKEIRLITAALPYTNNVPHLGHIAGSHLPADIFARFSRAMGHNTLFIGGTDEHGTTSEIAAQKYNIHPKELCDFFYKIHNEIYRWFEISYDNFSRTSRPIHYKTTIEIAARIKKNGFIIEQKIKTPFCKACNRELADRYIEGKCPNCSYEKAKGDQCEQCGELLEPTRLIAPCCVVCKSKNILFEDKSHLFLELKKLSKKIETWLKNNKQIRTQVKSIAFSWINKGLKPRCITRSLNWGIPVPFRGYEHLKFYVWLDAPIGYISATKEHTKKWKLYWQNPKARIYHFLGKDNIPFHTIFWPGILIADGTYNLPYNVIGLQYLNYEGRKFSKSNNWGVFCENLPDAGLPAEYWRFYLAFLIPEAKDMEFFWTELQARVDTELVGIFSNFIHRTLVF
ncbi:methionine--tRNA ligase, partial [archaeon]|nr:methionine--tRNA ligase [archaeon]